MKFPITRESLQAFDYVQNKAEKDEIAMQNHITLLVQDICGQIEHILSWTMSAPGGQCRTQSSINNAQLAHQHMMIHKRFVWNGIKNIRTRPSECTGRYVVEADESILRSRLLDKLRETFIGCDIITDPLKTYLIIDWS